MKKIVSLIMLLTVGLTSLQAQETEKTGPQKGTVTVSLLLGNTSTYSAGNWFQLPAAGDDSYTVYSPMQNGFPTENSLINMIGAEGKWFFSDTWAVRLSGAALLSSSPSYEGTPGVEGSSVLTTIPKYNDVPARENAEVIINAGVDKYFATPNQHLFWYVAPVLNFHYARKTGYEVSGADPTYDPGTTRYAEAWGLGLSGIAGVEYYTATGIFFGFELQAGSYMYTKNTLLPQEGLETLSADNHNFSFLSSPTVKIGFKF
jgi:hypothetical protein